MPPYFRSKRRLLVTATVLFTCLAGGVLLLRPQKECQAEPAGAAKATKAGASSKVSKPPVAVGTLALTHERLEIPLPATGTLAPSETVTLVSELSRRLIKIHVEEGQQVAKGALLFELDTSDVAAERKRLEVQLELARKSAIRQRELVSARVGTEAEAEVAETKVAELLASRNMLDVTIAKSQIRAPFGGVLGLRKVSVGSWVTPSTPLITLSDVSQLKIDFRVPERHASAVRVGSTFQLRVDGNPGTFQGKVIATEASVDLDSRSLAVRGVVEAQGLLPGAFAKVEIPVVVDKAILIPTLAVIPGVEGRGVYVARDGVAKFTQVELGERTASRVQVLSGLTVGDQLIVSNLLRVSDGAPLKVEPRAP
jgi:membrane fusion protein (multidrug efflux system)